MLAAQQELAAGLADQALQRPVEPGENASDETRVAGRDQFLGNKQKRENNGKKMKNKGQKTNTSEPNKGGKQLQAFDSLKAGRCKMLGFLLGSLQCQPLLGLVVVEKELGPCLRPGLAGNPRVPGANEEL